MIDGLDQDQRRRHPPYPGRVIAGHLDMALQIWLGSGLQELTVPDRELPR